MLTFHGFGQDNTDFEKLENIFSEKYTVYGIDLFYHGKSIRPYRGSPVSKIQWAELIQGFLNKNNITDFSLLGFSLGGKCVLALPEFFKERINEIILIAPDGVKENPWYKAATSFPPLRSFLKFTINKPAVFFRLVKIFRALRLVSKRAIRFVEGQMDTSEKRTRVYYTWTAFRKLKTNIRRTADIINEKKISVSLFTGKYDKIISSERVKLLKNKLLKCNFIELNAGHNNLINEVHTYLIKKSKKD